MRKLHFPLAFSFALLVPAQVLASPSYSYPTVSIVTAERDLPCYMHTAQSLILNLSSFCTTSSTKSPGSSAFGSPAYTRTYSNSDGLPDGTYTTINGQIVDPSGDGTGSSGSCNSPDQRDSRGYRCGGRTASEKDGGR